MRINTEDRKPVSSEQIAKWKRSYKIGDLVQICKKHDLSISTVSMAFKGTATNNTIKCINEFYKLSTNGRKLKRNMPSISNQRVLKG